MNITVICTTIPTQLTINVPSGSGPVSLEQMRTGAAPMAPLNLASGTTATQKVGPGAYKIVGNGISVTASPSSASQVQIETFTKTDPPEQMRLTLAAAPFTQAQLNAFMIDARSEDIVPPPPPPR